MRFLIPLVLAACGSSPSPVPEASAEPPAAAEVVATWKGGQVTVADLEADVEQELMAMEQKYMLDRYQLLSQVLERAVDDALLESEAEARKQPDVRTLLSLEVEEKITLPSDADIESFYTEVQGQLRGAALEEVRPMLTAELMQRRMAERYQAYVADLRKQKHVESSLPYPELQRVDFELLDTDPVKGAADAPVTIVQFAEYQCYFCNKVSPTLDALLEDYDGKVKLVFKDYPLDNHKRAMPAAVAARCAGEQGKYWEMNRTLLGNQAALSDSDFDAYASKLGLSLDKFHACVESGRQEPLIRQGFEAGQRAGVQATPTFYVNGLLVSGAQPYDLFKTVIEQELAKR